MPSSSEKTSPSKDQLRLVEMLMLSDAFSSVSAPLMVELFPLLSGL
jgi:hypothetical protein